MSTASTQAAPVIFSLGGRQFAPAEAMTFARKLWNEEHCLEAGLALPSPDVLAAMVGTDTSAAAARDALLQHLTRQLIRSPRVYHLIAGSLQEVTQGTVLPWRRPWAEALVPFLEELTDPAEHQLLHTAMAGLVVGFFRSLAASSMTSPNSSASPATRATSLGSPPEPSAGSEGAAPSVASATSSAS